MPLDRGKHNIYPQIEWLTNIWLNWADVFPSPSLLTKKFRMILVNTLVQEHDYKVFTRWYHTPSALHKIDHRLAGNAHRKKALTCTCGGPALPSFPLGNKCSGPQLKLLNAATIYILYFCFIIDTIIRDITFPFCYRNITKIKTKPAG